MEETMSEKVLDAQLWCADATCELYGAVHPPPCRKRTLVAKAGEFLDATKPPQQPDRLKEGANAIRARIKEERKLYAHYLVHVDRMKEQEDLHGGWDAFANASEVSNRIDMLEWCLGQLGEAL
jgi:hypothetical protein